MRKFLIFWRDIKIIIRAVWLNLLLFVMTLISGALFLRLSPVYSQLNWIDLLVDAFHMTALERVMNAGDGIVPAILTFILPFLSAIILGEGVLRVFSAFMARGKNREEWDKMVAETFSNHIVICGIGELGKALVKRLHTDHPNEKIIMIDQHQGLHAELSLNEENLLSIQSDMTNIEILKQVNCDKARLIVLASGNDATNLETAYKIVRQNPATEIWVRLHNSSLVDLMDLARKPNLHFFCPYQQAADVIANQLLQEDKP